MFETLTLAKNSLNKESQPEDARTSKKAKDCELHNHVTRSIYLAPFTLGETEDFLSNNHIVFNRHQIIECYMMLGGTPYYLNMLQPKLSLAQNINKLFFEENGELKREFDFLFRSLFKDSKNYRKVVELLSKKAKGMTRQEIILVFIIPPSLYQGFHRYGRYISMNPFEITPSYLEHIIHHRELFRQATGTKKALHLTFITTYGVVKNAQYGMIQSEVTMDDLFA